MVSGKPAERAVQTRRVVAAHVDAASAQAVPESPRGSAETAQPVIEQAHAHAFPRLGDQGIGECPSRRVFVDDVALEVHVTFCGSDGLKPRRIILARVPEQSNGIAVDEGRAGRARERPVGERLRVLDGLPSRIAERRGHAHFLELRHSSFLLSVGAKRARVDAVSPRPSGNRPGNAAPAALRNRRSPRRRSPSDRTTRIRGLPPL